MFLDPVLEIQPERGEKPQRRVFFPGLQFLDEKGTFGDSSLVDVQSFEIGCHREHAEVLKALLGEKTGRYLDLILGDKVRRQREF